MSMHYICTTSHIPMLSCVYAPPHPCITSVLPRTSPCFRACLPPPSMHYVCTLPRTSLCFRMSDIDADSNLPSLVRVHSRKYLTAPGPPPLLRRRGGQRPHRRNIDQSGQPLEHRRTRTRTLMGRMWKSTVPTVCRRFSLGPPRSRNTHTIRTST